MDNTIAHQLRLANKMKAHEQIKNDAKSLVAQYLQENPLMDGSDLMESYQTINEILENKFETLGKYQLARQGFLECVRDYNHTHGLHLDEPVVPVLAKRDDLTIGYDWFVRGVEVAQSTDAILAIWSNKRKFTESDLIEGVLYCSVIYGGLNDILALRALYHWLFEKRDIYHIQLPQSQNETDINTEFLAVIPLTINDDNYGCKLPGTAALSGTSDNSLQRYFNYIPDDMTLCFLYALKGRSFKQESTKSFNSIITNLSKKLKLLQKDVDKPHLSQLVKYANYHWRQSEGAPVSNVLSIVMQGSIQTTALRTDSFLHYNKEQINSNPEPLNWSDLSDTRYLADNNDRSAESKVYPEFSKNLIKAIQDSLKGTRFAAVNEIEILLREFCQPNAERILGWVLELLNDQSLRLNTIAKYVGCIGRDWLMLTMNEELEQWDAEDFEVVYEQVIQSKIKDGRKHSILKKESEFSADDISINDDSLEQEAAASLINELDNKKSSLLDKFKDNQKFTYGRLRAFHDYQRRVYDAPYVSFPWGNNRQVVKAHMISPRIYHAMKHDLINSLLDPEQKALCLVTLSLAYRTGMRIKELIGIEVSDIADIYTDNNSQKAEAPQIWLRPNQYRRLKSDSAKRCIPIYCLLKEDEMAHFIRLYQRQQRLKRRYLFSQGTGDYPLPNFFFTNLMKRMWDRLLVDHDFTFHSFRHTAISQLALVLNDSPLTQLMTDYHVRQCKLIAKSILGGNIVQGAWFGLASFAGHLTCDTTFEYYIHTAHLLAGWQLSQAELKLPLTVFESFTNLGYQAINRQHREAYEAKTKQVRIRKVRTYLIKHLVDHKDALFIMSSKQAESCQPSNDNSSHEELIEKSIFTHPKYVDVIVFLEELQVIDVAQRSKQLGEVALRHGINIAEAELINERAGKLFKDNRLLLSAPKGEKNHEVLVKALARAYQMSIEEPQKLRGFVKIFSDKQNLKSSSLQFGVKSEQEYMLKDFVRVGCELIDSSHWQIRAASERNVIEIKKSLGFDSRIRIGMRKNYSGYEVRVVQKKTKRSIKNMATTDNYLASSGVLKYFGYLLMILLEF